MQATNIVGEFHEYGGYDWTELNWLVEKISTKLHLEAVGSLSYSKTFSAYKTAERKTVFFCCCARNCSSHKNCKQWL